MIDPFVCQIFGVQLLEYRLVATRAVLLNFVVPKKFCLRHIIKTKIFLPLKLIFPPNFKTWLRACLTIIDVCKF